MKTLSVLVTVGSDHHPFDRLIGWVDEWLAQRHGKDVSCVLQHGTARPPRHGIPYGYLPHDELQQLLGAADVVVTQGGPMGIIESYRRGVKPIAVPRRTTLGEVVDDHQVDFCRHMASSDKLVLAEDAAALHTALDAAVSDPGTFRVEPGALAGEVDETVRRFDLLASALPPRRGLFSLTPRRRPATHPDLVTRDRMSA
ncbi:MAG: glycosyltransferase [Nocardioidaceae bacterium]